MIYVLALILLGFAVTGFRSLLTSERGLTKGEAMQLAKSEFESDMQVIANFPDPAIQRSAALYAQQKFRRKLEEILKQA
jgi:hypothetical protein